MGFEGDDFLNCVVWVQSVLTPEKILKKILSIEKRMGRVRKKGQGYSSRIIDIDLLFVDGKELVMKELVVPHPEIANRRFVLQPMAELNPQFVHPILKKSIIWLLAKTRDESILIKTSKWLRNPKKDYSFNRYKYIAIEGNIGAGKTSLATQLAYEFNAKLILEGRSLPTIGRRHYPV